MTVWIFILQEHFSTCSVFNRSIYLWLVGTASPLFVSWRVLDHVGFPFLPADKAKLLQENVLPSVTVFGWTGLKHLSSRVTTTWFGDSHGGFGSCGHPLSRVQFSVFTLGNSHSNLLHLWVMVNRLFLCSFALPLCFPPCFANGLFPVRECRIHPRLYLSLTDVFHLSCGIYFSDNIQNLAVNALSNLFYCTCVSYCCPVVTELLINNLSVKFKHSLLASPHPKWRLPLQSFFSHFWVDHWWSHFPSAFFIPFWTGFFNWFFFKCLEYTTSFQVLESHYPHTSTDFLSSYLLKMSPQITHAFICFITDYSFFMSEVCVSEIVIYVLILLIP